ncbi:hypothetical protein NUW58_g7913 [Xylaria curta]|uniref:Uncharacterized protein n=1 Tax=Xylaria curta TaxID=42375 RepID=A0ACC1NDW1_9PEZI|nr:hypothetical protein NUW58_g7913 [Xylaria curta]
MIPSIYASRAQNRPVPIVQQRDVDDISLCRCFPGDPCWPTEVEWIELNKTLHGKLIATIPIASVCHDSPFLPYNSEACASLRSVWNSCDTHLVTSSSPMAPFFANMSCDPFTPREAQCIIGAYVRYAVNASSADDYKLALSFARRHNLRLVIRNTGHDYFGKSTGPGALAIWTNHLKGITISNYRSVSYTGKAIRVNAGVSNLEAQTAAHAKGLVITTGDSSSVGLAGGYAQGGGHGPLASTLGLAADQILEWEVITAKGDHLKATPSLNSDLYWALSGGGGGTYGVVVSMTMKAYPEMKVAIANITFKSDGVLDDTFYSAISSFLPLLSSLSDRGAVGIWLLSNGVFIVQQLSAPGMDRHQLQTLLQPGLDLLARVGILYEVHIESFPSYFDGYHRLSAEPNITEYSIGGRLIPRSLLSSDNSAAPLVDALRFIVKNGGVVSGVTLNVTKLPSSPNSVNPKWRTTACSIVIGVPYDPFHFEVNIYNQRKITNVFMPKLAELTPHGAAYLNEGDFRQPNFQDVFFGVNYNRLLSIKRKYDPDGNLHLVSNGRHTTTLIFSANDLLNHAPLRVDQFAGPRAIVPGTRTLLHSAAHLANVQSSLWLPNYLTGFNTSGRGIVLQFFSVESVEFDIPPPFASKTEDVIILGSTAFFESYSDPQRPRESTCELKFLRCDVNHVRFQFVQTTSLDNGLSMDDISLLSPEEQAMLLEGPALPPPAGVSSNFDNPPNRNALSNGIISLILALATLGLIVRTYSRLVCVKQVRVEDYLALGSYATIVTLAVLLYRLIGSIGFFVHQWDVRLRDLNIASSSVNLAVDFFILALPQGVIWKLQMSRKGRFGLSLVFTIGLLAVAVASYRLAAAVTFYQSPDALYQAPGLAFAALAEPTCVFLVFCLPAAPVAFRNVRNRLYLASLTGRSKPKSSAELAPEIASDPPYRKIRDDDTIHLTEITAIGTRNDGPHVDDSGILRTTQFNSREDPVPSNSAYIEDSYLNQHPWDDRRRIEE